MPTKITLAGLSQSVPDEYAAYTWLESIRWPDEPVCPHCGTIGRAYYLAPKGEGRKTRTGAITQRKLWKCGSCRKQFSVIKGTCMEGSKIPVRKWVLAFHLLAAAKNGLSSHELGRILDISHESAWFMSHRIRYAFAPSGPQPVLSGIVEADETYIGGKRKGTPKGRPGPDSHKSPVVTLVERDGEARSRAVVSVTSKNVGEMLHMHVAESATIMTDEFPLYRKITKGFAGHGIVTHKEGEYVREEVHTNTAEGYFSQLKRSLHGTHHHVSAKHLHRYLGEFDFRYSTRKETDGDRMVRAVRKSAGKRMRYESVTGKLPQPDVGSEA